MSPSVAIGFSQAENIKDAAYQAAISVKNQLNCVSTDMVIIFSSVHYADKEALEVIHTILKPTRLIGASSAGIIHSQGIFNRGIVVLGVSSKDISFGIGASAYIPGQDFRRYGRELNRSLTLDYKSNLPRQAAIIFCDGRLPYSNQFILGAQEVLGNSCPISGAFSWDEPKFKKGYQFFQKQLLSMNSAGFLIGSSSTIAFSNKHGFKPLGKPRTITSSKGSVIHTIDDKPAISIYEDYLKSETPNLTKGFYYSPATYYPLGIYLENQRQYLLRYPVDILHDGSIVCQADVPSGSEVHLTINNKESCKKAATAAAKEIKDKLEGRPPKLLFIFESVVRHRILGRHLLTEVQAIKDILGHATPLIGMYSFGEFCHLGVSVDNTDTYLQNASLSLLAIG